MPSPASASVSPDKGAYLRFHGSRELASGVDALYLSGYGD
jgi:hypothetical protein